MDFYDLNFVPTFSSPILLRTHFEESWCESRTNHFCPSHGIRLPRRISTLRSEIRRKSQRSKAVVLEPVSGHGLCPTDLSPQPSRHRSLFAGATFQALSLRFQIPHPTLHPGRRQRAARLENLRRLCSYPDRHRSTSVCGHRSWNGSGGDRVCSGRYHHRSVSEGFPWAIYKRAKGAIKLHTLMEVHSSIPVFIDITHAKVHDVHFLDVIVPEPGSFLVMDRAYIDFARLYALHQALAFFVVRAKQNFQFRRRSSQTVDRLTGLRSDQTVSLTGPLSRKSYPIPLRRVSYYSEQTDQSLVFLTNNFSIAPLTVAAIYRYRWQIELFFKWIKQHLRIKRFLGTSPNSVKSQIWIAVAVYVLIAIIKKKLGLQQNLYTILQVLSLTLFEKNSILSLFENSDDTEKILNPGNQLFLFQN